MIKEKTVKELLDDLQSIVNLLKSSLPKEAPIFISKSIDPARALHLREACIHRITELAESACDAFKSGNNVAGYLLARAIMETFALFWYFTDKVRDALKDEDVEKVRAVLTRMMVGAKVEKAKDAIVGVLGKTKEAMGKSLDPIHVLDLIRHLAKEIPPFMDHYEFLCEVAHPNATGLLKAYVRNDWDKGVSYFGREQGSFGSHLESDLQALIVSLEGFMDLYADSAELLLKFQKACEM
jgi:hypothetical protein